VAVTVERGLLTIHGQRHHDDAAAGQKVHRAERRYGPFRRSITLPGHADGARSRPQRRTACCRSECRRQGTDGLKASPGGCSGASSVSASAGGRNGIWRPLQAEPQISRISG
jgi:hypothetical protein